MNEIEEKTAELRAIVRRMKELGDEIRLMERVAIYDLHTTKEFRMLDGEFQELDSEAINLALKIRKLKKR